MAFIRLGRTPRSLAGVTPGPRYIDTIAEHRAAPIAAARLREVEPTCLAGEPWLSRA